MHLITSLPRTSLSLETADIQRVPGVDVQTSGACSAAQLVLMYKGLPTATIEGAEIRTRKIFIRYPEIIEFENSKLNYQER